MNNKILSKYNNGNTVVTIFEDGTKIREFEDGVKPFSNFPESIDIKLTNKCDLGCKFCLDGKTKIFTDNGQINIEDLNKGDIVLSYNVKKNNLELNEITQTLKRKYKGKIIEIVTDTEKILITPEHKIFTKNRGWIKAKNINKNDILLDI